MASKPRNSRRKAVKGAKQPQTPPKRSKGRPAHQPTAQTRATVEAMAGHGAPENDIADLLKIARNTLRAHYADELHLGRIKANSMVAQSLFKKATGDGPGAITAAIFWSKVRMGWKEPAQDHNHRGAIGAFDLTKVSDADLDKLERILAAAALAGPDQGGEGA